jgi:hypothetical protein
MLKVGYWFLICDFRFANRKFMKEHKGMRPQDVVVLLKIVSLDSPYLPPAKEGGLRLQPTRKNILNKELADSLGISTAEISASLYRSEVAGLLDRSHKQHPKVFKKSLFEFLRYGVKYVFPGILGPIVRGVPTAYSAEPLRSKLTFQEEIVWEYSEGTLRGQSVEPLYSTVPGAVKKDSYLHELLALTDALRIGGAREVELATKELEKRFFA